MNSPSLDRLGYKPFFANQCASIQGDVYPARVAARQRNGIVTISEYGERHVPAGLLLRVGELTVGDWLAMDAASGRGVARLERSSLLSRMAPGDTGEIQPIAANVDTLLIVTSCNRDFNPARLQRYLALARQADVTPVIVITRSDTANDISAYCAMARALQPGLPVEAVNALDPTTLSSLAAWFVPGDTLAMLGSSGVGKTTLANSLGAPMNRTAAIREDDARGRHTTTARYLHPLPSGALLIDNPGIRELALAPGEDETGEVFEEWLQGNRCRFADCSHDREPGCAVREAIADGRITQRILDNHRKLEKEKQRLARTLAERHASDRETGKLYRRVKGAKRARREPLS